MPSFQLAALVAEHIPPDACVRYYLTQGSATWATKRRRQVSIDLPEQIAMGRTLAVTCFLHNMVRQGWVEKRHSRQGRGLEYRLTQHGKEHRYATKATRTRTDSA
jgi:hypothetical protein